jgi:hypothetical protein
MNDKMTPTDCINSNCKNIVFLPYYKIHNRVLCENCLQKKENSEDKIIVEYWLKNNIEWYQPKNEVDLSIYDNLELLSKSFYGDLFYAYNDGDKENGRLFRGKWNKGLI